jgi:hypothetical protein
MLSNELEKLLAKSRFSHKRRAQNEGLDALVQEKRLHVLKALELTLHETIEAIPAVTEGCF